MEEFCSLVFFLRFVANNYLQSRAANPQDVEWGFAFDIHLNAFFPVLILLHVVQLILFIREYYAFLVKEFSTFKSLEYSALFHIPFESKKEEILQIFNKEIIVNSRLTK